MIIFIIKSWILEERLKKVSAVKIIKQTHSHAHALFDNNDLSQIILSDDNDMIDASDASDAENETSKKQKQRRKTDVKQYTKMSDII